MAARTGWALDQETCRSSRAWPTSWPCAHVDPDAIGHAPTTRPRPPSAQVNGVTVDTESAARPPKTATATLP